MGPQGLTGPKGDKGDPGAPGAQGDAGTAGTAGAPGAAGAKGDTGDAGSDGSAGADGAAGAAGPAGPAGPQGAKGEKGDAGAAGPQGAKGDKGDTGPSLLPTAKEVYLDADVTLVPATSVAVTAIRLTAGTYFVNAKTTLAQTAGKGAAGTEIRCAVNGDPASPAVTDDSAATEFAKDVGYDTLAMATTITLAADSTVVLRCLRVEANAGKTFVARETKIIASPLQATDRVAGTAGASGN